MKQNFIIKAIFKVLAVILITVVLAPSVVKFSHIFTHHNHKVCNITDASNTHFHTLDLDCELYKFKLSNYFYFSTKNTPTIVVLNNYNLIDSVYSYTTKTPLKFKQLRAPPVA